MAALLSTPASAPSSPAPQQRVIKVRRDYNAWVASETLEDHALRFAPRSFRKWSEWQVAHTALGGAASFLVLEALGATLLLQFGFINTFWAVPATAAKAGCRDPHRGSGHGHAAGAGVEPGLKVVRFPAAEHRSALQPSTDGKLRPH
jgi:hypothetical protein